MTEADTRQSRPLAIAFFLAFAVGLLWPALVSGELYTFHDTRSYLRGGEKIWDIFFQMLSSPSPEAGQATGERGAPAALTINEEGRNVSGRSFPYSAFAYLAYVAGGPVGLMLAQAAVATILIRYLISREAYQSPGTLIIGAFFISIFTALPWYTSFLMPDLFGAFVVLFGIVLVRGIDDLGFWSATLLVALAGFAATAHYGNMPLMLGVVLVSLGIRLLRWRLTWNSVIAGIVAASLAPLANLVASTVVLDEPSIAPRRLPIILSRSISDGPALWYLQEVCPEAGYAMCEAYGDRLQASTGWFLWSDEGVLSLPKETLDRIRAEEKEIVLGAFLAYPLAQTKSLLKNVWLQLMRVGITEIGTSSGISAQFDPMPSETNRGESLKVLFDKIIPLATFGSAVALLGFGLFLGFSARWIDMLGVMALGYLGNAMIFGGLSSPIDRYQGRTAWIIPVLLVVYVAEMTSRHQNERRLGKRPTSPPQ